jgi:hypothetical protein
MCPSYKKRGFWFVDSRYTWLDLGIRAKCNQLAYQDERDNGGRFCNVKGG